MSRLRPRARGQRRRLSDTIEPGATGSRKGKVRIPRTVLEVHTGEIGNTVLRSTFSIKLLNYVLISDVMYTHLEKVS